MKKKVLIMINGLYGGGAERVLQTILKHLDSSKYDITLMSLHREKIDKSLYPTDFHYKVVFDEVQGSGIVKVWNILFSKIKGRIFMNCSASRFYPMAIKEKYDVEIAFLEGESTKIISGSTNPNSRKIAWVHVDLEQNPWTQFLYKGDEDEAEHYRKFDRVVCVSDTTRDAFLRKYKVDSNKVITHRNPIDSEYIKNMSEKSNVELDHDKIQIICVGRLVKQKGYDRLIKAVQRVVKNNKNFQIHIIGEGEDHKELQDAIDDGNLNEFITLHGYMNNPYAFMKAGDVLFCSSRAEGYSLVVAEGMILGLAIVTTNCSGVGEFTEDGKYGILMENSEDGIYEGLQKITDHPELIPKYRELARKRSAMFDVKENIRDLEKIIDE